MKTSDFILPFLLIAVILTLIKFSQVASRKLKLPDVLGELVVGIILGPTVLGILFLSPEPSSTTMTSKGSPASLSALRAAVTWAPTADASLNAGKISVRDVTGLLGFEDEFRGRDSRLHPTKGVGQNQVEFSARHTKTVPSPTVPSKLLTTVNSSSMADITSG